MSSRTPAEVLAQSRRRDSQAKRGKVLAVLEDMTRRGDPVSFTAVAKSAGVRTGSSTPTESGNASRLPAPSRTTSHAATSKPA